MTQKFLGRVAGLALLLGASQADATIYDLDLTFGWNVNGQSGTGTITGTVQTDGNLGVLSSADITNWNLSIVSAPTATFHLQGPPSPGGNTVFVTGSGLTATSAGNLYFDFSQS